MRGVTVIRKTYKAGFMVPGKVLIMNLWGGMSHPNKFIVKKHKIRKYVQNGIKFQQIFFSGHLQAQLFLGWACCIRCRSVLGLDGLRLRTAP